MTTERDMACGLYRAVLDDILSWDCSRHLSENLEEDFRYLTSIIRTRGVTDLMSTLPAMGKVFDKSISHGILYKDLVPKRYPSSADGFPSLFSSLFELVFDRLSPSSDGTWHIRYDVDPNAIFFLRQLLLSCKKVRKPCSSTVERQALTDFVEIDSLLRVPTLPWDQHSKVFQEFLPAAKPYLTFEKGSAYLNDTDKLQFGSSRVKRLSRMLDIVTNIIGSRFKEFDPLSIVPSHGPGAVSDLKGGTDKYTFPMWDSSLGNIFPQDHFAWYSEEVANLSDGIPEGLSTAKVLSVPKTIDAPRLITAEPTAKQFIQQGLLRWMRENFPHPIQNCYSFNSQEPSRELALENSGSLESATVDLSSASDRLSCWAVERFLLPTGILTALQACRSQYVVDGTGQDMFGPLSLKKFSGQGSGVTFPVQSYCYAICAIAAILLCKPNNKVTYRSILRASRKVQVYGDDLIVPVVSLPYLVLILEFLQLKVNVSKTHYEGGFRESCGMDAWRGNNVSPVYLSSFQLGRTPKDLVSWIDVCNNAHSAGLWNLASYMHSTIPHKQARLLACSSIPQGVLTLRTFSSGTTGRIGKQHPDLQVDTILGLKVKTKVRIAQCEEYQALHRFFTDSYLDRNRGRTPWLENPWSLRVPGSTNLILKVGRVPLR